MSLKKRCFVPSCQNIRQTGSEISGKLFLTVPHNWERRKKWFEAINVDATQGQTRSPFFCCEDHFDLATDAENWMYYKTLGRCLTLRKDVVPHKNLSGDLKFIPASQFSDSDKKRKLSYLDACRKEPLQKVKHQLFSEASREPPVEAATSQQYVAVTVPPVQVATNATIVALPSGELIGCISGDEPLQLYTTEVNTVEVNELSTAEAKTEEKRFVSRGVQVNLRKKFRSVKVGTKAVKRVSRATSPCEELDTKRVKKVTRAKPFEEVFIIEKNDEL